MVEKELLEVDVAEDAPLEFEEAGADNRLTAGAAGPVLSESVSGSSGSIDSGDDCGRGRTRAFPRWGYRWR